MATRKWIIQTAASKTKKEGGKHPFARERLGELADGCFLAQKFLVDTSNKK